MNDLHCHRNGKCFTLHREEASVVVFWRGDDPKGPRQDMQTFTGSRAYVLALGAWMRQAGLVQQGGPRP